MTCACYVGDIGVLLFIPVTITFTNKRGARTRLRDHFFLFDCVHSKEGRCLMKGTTKLLISKNLATFLTVIFLLMVYVLEFNRCPSLVSKGCRVTILINEATMDFLELFLGNTF